MKRLIAIVLAICLCFVFSACEEKKASISSTSSVESVQSSPIGETPAPETQAGSTPLLYRAEHTSGGVVWLFGSIHVGLKEMYPLPKYVISAYYESEKLAVECDITAEEDMSQAYSMLKAFACPNGTTIEDHISPEVYEKAKQALEELGFYNEYLDYYKPILWQNFIEVSMYDTFGYDSDLGIDRHLLELAAKDKKEIAEIESAEFQYNMLSDFSLELQALLLEETVEDYFEPDDAKKDMDELFSLWREGNEQEFSKLLNEEDLSELNADEIELLEEYDKAMLTDRNIGMADYAEEELTNGKKTFICVGAAHIVGEGAVVDLLRERGYTVELISN